MEMANWMRATMLSELLLPSYRLELMESSAPYYPGDEYVDAAGVSVYCKSVAFQVTL